MAKSQTRKQSTEMASLSNDVEKIQLEDMEEIYEGGDKVSQTPAVDEGEKNVRKLRAEKGKSKQGNFFGKVNRILF